MLILGGCAGQRAIVTQKKAESKEPDPRAIDHFVDGIIYDSVTEVTDEYILLATCNGDKEKIFSNGTSAYLPAGGGEFYSLRIENF